MKYSVPIYFVTSVIVEAEDEFMAQSKAESLGVCVGASVNGEPLQIDYEDTGEPLAMDWEASA